MIITEPRWKSYCVETTKPLFSPKHCQMVIEAGREEPRHNASVGSGKKDGGIVDTNTRTSHISWIPFSKMPEMYRDIETTMKKVNGPNNEQLMKRFRVSSFPTIILVKGKSPKTYSGDRSVSDMKRFLK